LFNPFYVFTCPQPLLASPCDIATRSGGLYNSLNSWLVLALGTLAQFLADAGRSLKMVPFLMQLSDPPCFAPIRHNWVQQCSVDMSLLISSFLSLPFLFTFFHSVYLFIICCSLLSLLVAFFVPDIFFSFLDFIIFLFLFYLSFLPFHPFFFLCFVLLLFFLGVSIVHSFIYFRVPLFLLSHCSFSAFNLISIAFSFLCLCHYFIIHYFIIYYFFFSIFCSFLCILFSFYVSFPFSSFCALLSTFFNFCPCLFFLFCSFSLFLFFFLPASFELLFFPLYTYATL
jgi:hypothetical protein